MTRQESGAGEKGDGDNPRAGAIFGQDFFQRSLVAE
jgi:hypothetical protein